MRRYISSIVGLFILFLFFAASIHAASCTFVDGIQQQSLAVGQSYCGGGNTLYTCVSENNVSTEKCPTGQECQYTDTRRTFAICGAPTTECKDSSYRVYAEGQSWCDRLDVYICQGGRAVKKETCSFKDGFVAECSIVDSVNRTAGCVSRGAPGCIDSLNQYHPPNTRFCSQDNSTINGCQGNSVVAVTQCDNQSCKESSASDASCVSGGIPTGGNDNYLKQFEQQTQCGGLGQKCCGQTNVIPYLEIPKPGIIGVDHIFAALNKVLEVYNNTLYKVINHALHDSVPQQMCKEGSPSNDTDLSQCTCRNPGFKFDDLCDNISSPQEKTSCIRCATTGVWTALGCVEYTFGKFIQDVVFGFGLRFAMAITFFCIIYGALQLQLSRGDAARIKKAQELITSCISGLMLIIFSIFILRVIGVDLLRIPGFGSVGGDINTKAVCIQNQNNCFLNKQSKCYSIQEYQKMCVAQGIGSKQLTVHAKFTRLSDGSCDQRGVNYMRGPQITPGLTTEESACGIRLDY